MPPSIAYAALVGQPCAQDEGSCAPCPYCTHLVDFGPERDGRQEARCPTCGRELALSWGERAITVRVLR